MNKEKIFETGVRVGVGLGLIGGGYIVGHAVQEGNAGAPADQVSVSMTKDQATRLNELLNAPATPKPGDKGLTDAEKKAIESTFKTPTVIVADIDGARFVVTPRLEPTAVPKKEATPVPVKTEAPKTVISVFAIKGAPDRVDANNVDTAKGDFKNTIGLGSEMMIAEPGVIKVGWDFPQDQFKAAGEHIYHYDSGNQSILQTPESFVNVPEGAFAMFNGNAMNIEVSGNGSARFRLEIPGPVNNHNIVIMRGLYRDGNSPADRNRIADVTGYTPGAVLYDMYPKGGFVSQGQFEQIAKNALTNSPNCGAEACRTVTAYFFDVNTGALSAIKTSGQAWSPVTSNWK